MLYVSTYRNKGYSFTITSSTAFDHKWIPNRNIFESISEVVDEVFASYLSRPNVRQPILTQYCDGQRVSCPNWLSQWGSSIWAIRITRLSRSSAIITGRSLYQLCLGDLRHSCLLARRDPGHRKPRSESRAASGAAECHIQPLSPDPEDPGRQYLRRRRSGLWRPFQGIFGLPETGEVDYRTWYKIRRSMSV